MAIGIRQEEGRPQRHGARLSIHTHTQPTPCRPIQSYCAGPPGRGEERDPSQYQPLLFRPLHPLLLLPPAPRRALPLGSDPLLMPRPRPLLPAALGRRQSTEEEHLLIWDPIP